MAEYYSDSRPELIHCEFCGEDYADTYKACPFCDTAPNGKKVRSRSAAPAKGARSGRRVRTNTRGGGYGGAKSPLAVIGIILAVGLLIAAVIIVATLIKSTLDDAEGSGVNAGVVSSQENENGGSSSATGSEDDGSVGAVAPDGLSLDKSTVSIFVGATATLTATPDPINWIGQIIWSTSDPSVATVDQNGLVTYVGDGTCTVTASANGVTATCTVTCGGTPDPVQSTIVITCYGNDMDGDFTLRMSDGTLPFKATGGDGENYTWSTGDPAVAIVDPSTGKVTPVGEGKTTLSCTSGEETTTVVLRVRD